MHKRGRRVLGIDHIGSARTEAELALLEAIAHERLHVGQDLLPLEHDGSSAPATTTTGMGATVAGTASRVLWQALERVYADLGFDVLGDEAFKQLVLARIIEPTSKADTVRVLEELGVPSRTRETFMRCLSRVVERNYRDQLGAACYAHAAPTGRLAAVLYDLTTLHFETPKEDGLRKVGMSKERRVDPQVTVGLLCDPGGFPLAVHLFEGNKAETKTLIPVLKEFQN
ncbi:IS1634 family transposase, partial [Ornithinimicrobium panacihumi]|uniref:IS1634 family transposase n=1 Tax=Ornithinimicrobium panacihumi TaxID=2008449 RepID=UPI003F890075